MEMEKATGEKKVPMIKEYSLFHDQYNNILGTRKRNCSMYNSTFLVTAPGVWCRISVALNSNVKHESILFHEILCHKIMNI